MAKKEYKVYVDGKFMPESEAKVSIFDHGFLYGDGVFEGIRAYNGRVFKLKQHLDRLYDSAKAIDLKVPIPIEDMGELILESCRVNGLRDAYMRPIVTRGVGDLGLDPRKCKEASVFIIAREFGALYGDKYDKGLTVVSVSTRRNPPQCLSPNIKSLNYLNNILARIEANQRNADEGLMLDVHGFVSEATADNIFLIKNGVVVTPPTLNSLKGITREAAIEVAATEGYVVAEHPITIFDVYAADEIFITGTAAEIAPIVEVDGRVIGDGRPGPITRQLMKAFARYVRSTGTPIYAEEPAPVQR